MIIETSNVSMSSTHSYFKYEKTESESLTVESSRAATIELSEESKNLVNELREKKEELAREDEDAKKEKEANNEENLKKTLEESLKANKADKNQFEIPTEEENKVKMLKRMLELINKIRNGKGNTYISSNDLKDVFSSFKENCASVNDSLQNLANTINGITPESVNLGNGTHTVELTKWTKITVQSSFSLETENTAYTSKGTVTTKDGRELTFNLTMELSRSFTEEYGSYMEESYTMVDPLVINLSDNAGDVTEKTFLFDLDADGTKENVHELAQGAGFLALDKNNDGTINSGAELFGAASGDGFKDLAEYDEDNNGWIDENDSVFNKLKIWTKDENDNMVLIDLKEADVGAICLQNTNTDYTLKSTENNATLGQIKKTGVFLHESTGSAGTVQHIDLAV